MWTVIALLLLAWLGGLLFSITFGGWILLLPAIALVLTVWQIYATLRRKNDPEPQI